MSRKTRNIIILLVLIALCLITWMLPDWLWLKIILCFKVLFAMGCFVFAWFIYEIRKDIVFTDDNMINEYVMGDDEIEWGKLRS